MTDNADLPWHTLPIDLSDPSLGTAQHATSIPYLPLSHSLQTLDLCLVPSLANSADITPERIPHEPTIATTTTTTPTFLIYIHGGAWRDPRQDSTTFHATLLSLLRRRALSPTYSQLRHLTGFASLNYTLSPHPDFPPEEASDHSRTGTHPAALSDVLAALAWLQRRFHFGRRYLLVGHSCGATLALQSVLGAPNSPDGSGIGSGSGSGNSSPLQHPPLALIALAGLYDLPLLVHSPGPMHTRHRDIYAAFTRGAFGADERAWAAASPACRSTDADADVHIPLAVLAYSRGDTLVPPNQADAMAAALAAGGWPGEVRRVELWGDHDVWRFGAEQIVNVVEGALERLREVRP